ncbi:MAG: Branched-chain amino acid transporter, amino acid-binding protein [Myxococcales bacterium]|nr:Branched-chain amino acid transporter, amino acid-binding protein [Myxococcales bacterium]
MKRLLLPLLMLTAGCGGKSGTLTLKMVVSPGDDPFADASQVRFTVGDAAHVTTVPVAAGHFTFSVSGKPQNTPGPVLVEALDSSGAVVAHGTTPNLLLSAIDQGPIAVWVGRPGRIAPAAAMLPTPVAEVATAEIPGLGVLYAGGRGADGNPVQDTAVYDIYTHDVINTAKLQKARAGGVGGAVSNVRAIVYGGSTSPGFGTFASVDGTMELFDPTVGLGVFAALPVDPIGGRAYANGTTLATGSILISGGVDASGAPIGNAGLVNPDGAIKLTQLASPMAAARVGHAVAPAKFPDGDGAILFGGLPLGSTGAPVVERLVGQSFAAYDVGALENRVQATATKMPSGDVLILGGRTASGAQASGVLLTPTTPGATVTPLPAAMSTARAGHTASLSGNELIVCGGADNAGVAVGSCDVLDAMTYAIKKTIPMATARRDHTAQVMETGIVVLAAGIGADNAPLGSIEIYTP